MEILLYKSPMSTRNRLIKQRDNIRYRRPTCHVVSHREWLVGDALSFLLDGDRNFAQRIATDRATDSEASDNNSLVAAHAHHTAVTGVDAALAESREPTEDMRQRIPASSCRKSQLW